MTDLPRELPVVPEGWTQRMSTHLNFGSGAACAVYTIHDPDGNLLPITFGYRTKRGGCIEWRGYSIDGSDVIHKSWAELVRVWPAYVKSIARLEASGKTTAEARDALRSPAALRMLVIRPKDHPKGFVVRTWVVKPGATYPAELLGADLETIDAARELVPAGLVNIGRTSDDDPKIVEVWV